MAIMESGLESAIRAAEKAIGIERDRLYSDLRAGRPDTLYHYTDALGLEGILREGRIWATKIAYLNDPLEVAYTERLIERLARESRILKRSATRVNLFEGLIRDPDFKGTASKQYCASFSAIADDLSQFRGYSLNGEGYCLEFSTETLLAKIKAHCPFAGSGCKFDLVRVEYDTETQIHSINCLLDCAEDMARRLTAEFPLGEEDILRRISQYLVRCFDYFKPCFKQPGFHAEEEWRIILSARGGLEAKAVDEMFNVRRRGSLFVPFLKIPISDDTEGQNALKAIFTAPKLNNTNALIGVQSLLATYKIDDVEVLPSSTIMV